MTENPSTEEVVEKRDPSRALFLTSLILALATFWAFGGLVLIFPAILAMTLEPLGMRQRLVCCVAWGCLFSAVFYSWAAAYGVAAWLGLIVVRGVPWILFGLPAYLLEGRVRERHGLVRALSTGLGLALVSGVLLLGLTGADWETPMGGLTLWPWALACLPWIGLEGGAFLIGFLSRLLFAKEHSGKFLALFGLLLWQLVNLTLFLRTDERGESRQLKVGLIQTGWSQDLKWEAQNIGEGKQRLLDLTEQAAGEGAQLIIWPETSWPHRGMRYRPSDSRKVGRLARRLNVELLASSIEEVPEGWYNSVSQILPTGRFGLEYRKQRLVPFAEYLPLPPNWQATAREMGPLGRVSPFLAGEQSSILESFGTRYGLMICYESMNGDLAEELAQKVDFFVIPTNDAPFDSELAKEAHFRSAILRAAEFRKPVLQSANTGVTGFVDGRGQVVGRSAPGFSGPDVQTYLLDIPK